MPKSASKERITITMNTEIQNKIRKIQAFLIANDSGNWSFSAVLNSLLKITVKTPSVITLVGKIKKAEDVL